MVALDHLAELFDGLAVELPRTALPLLVRAVEVDGAVELGVLELLGEHPAGALLGMEAPPGCVALGVVSTGWSLPPARFDEHDLALNRRVGVPAADSPDRVAVRSAVLVDRSCGVAGRLSVDGAPPVTSAPEHGLVLDLLLRAMGCPTPPAAVGTLELFAALWLSRLAADPPVGWADAAAEHWALQLTPGPATSLVERAEELAEVVDWGSVRRAVANAGMSLLCTPAEAAWFDDGSFARWVLGSFPPLDDLARGLPPSLARRVRGALRAWRLGEYRSVTTGQEGS